MLWAADVPGINDVGPAFPGDPIFADSLVEYHGQSIFAVAADSIAAACCAAMRARIEYEVLPPILDIDAAMQAQSFVLPSQTMRRGEPETWLPRAARRLAGRVRVGGQEHFYLEGQVAMAIPGEDGDMLVYSSTQHPTEVQHLVARSLALHDHDVVCETRRMGGGFGGKESQANADPPSLAALAGAASPGRPAKVRLDRDERLRADRQTSRFPCIDWEVGFRRLRGGSGRYDLESRTPAVATRRTCQPGRRRPGHVPRRFDAYFLPACCDPSRKRLQAPNTVSATPRSVASAGRRA